MQHPRHGDERELFQLHNRRLVNVIRRRFRLSEEEARDVAQFAWLKFLEKQPARTNMFGWLYTTAKHEVYARSRRAKRERAAEPVPEQSHDPDLPARFDRAEVARLLLTVMRTRLTENQRDALTLGPGLPLQGGRPAARQDLHLGEPPHHRRPRRPTRGDARGPRLMNGVHTHVRPLHRM
jgi:hypothetical protein